MGEYATYKGDSIKIGTCESMYYLRADQAHLVSESSVDTIKAAEAGHIRFRFPFPDEDNLEPGIVGHEEFDRGVGLPLLEVPEEASRHYTVQFRADSGHRGWLPCPEGPDALEGYTFHRNGGGPKVVLKQQKVIGDDLVAVCGCAACGSLYRIEDPSYFDPVLELLEEWDEWAKTIASGETVKRPANLHGVTRELMDRVLDGYNGGWARLRAGEGVAA